jgi:glycosyltransferase involved in cell wall biosynthesis
MRVTHFSYYKSGGAGNVAETLNSLLNKRGIDSNLFYASERGLKYNKKKILNILTAIIDNAILRKKKSNLISVLRFKISKQKVRKMINRNEIDIYHFHWIPGIVNIKMLKKLVRDEKKIVWTLHDMFPLSGGCHIEFSCTQFDNNCKVCPATRSYFRKNIENNRKRMDKIFKNYKNIIYVAPSKKIYELALKNSRIEDGKLKLIYNPSRNEKQAKVSLTSVTINIGMGALEINDKNKNIIETVKKIDRIVSKNRLLEDKIQINLIGNCNQKIDTSFVRVKILGFLSDELAQESLRTCQIWIQPSFQESYSLMLVEAVKAGIPVITRNTGIAPEIVIEGKNGYIYQNDEQLEDYLGQLINSQELRQKLSDHDDLSNNFNNNVILKSYIKIYDELNDR